MIASDLSGNVVEVVVEVGDTTRAYLAAYDGLVVNAPTWSAGADMDHSGTERDNILYE